MLRARGVQRFATQALLLHEGGFTADVAQRHVQRHWLAQRLAQRGSQQCLHFGAGAEAGNCGGTRRRSVAPSTADMEVQIRFYCWEDTIGLNIPDIKSG